MSDYTSVIRLGPNGPEHTVVLKGGLQPGQTEPALYHVTCHGSDRRIEVERADGIGTENAAVNGIQNDLDRAAVVMLDKVATTADLRRGDAPTEFTLYHVPTRGFDHDVALAGQEMAGITTPDAAKLSKVLENTSASGQHVVWSVHSRGAAVFEAAARDCARRDVHLTNESVAIYNGAANMFLMKHDLRRAGVSTVGHGFYNHPFDPVPQLIGDNMRNPVQIAGALYNATRLNSPDKSVHTWHVQLTDRDYNSVPSAEWERPGIDLRASRAPAGKPAAPSTAHESDRSGKTGAGQLTEPALLRATGLDQNDSTLRLLRSAVAGREAYAHAQPEERSALVDRCRQDFKRDLDGPELTALPLRNEALGYVRGEVTAESLLGAAQQHSAAVELARSLSRAPASPELGLSR